MKKIKELILGIWCFVRNVKVVQFDNGRYAIRKGRVCFGYLDLVDLAGRSPKIHWRKRNSTSDCFTKDINVVMGHYNNYRYGNINIKPRVDYGTPVVM